MPLCNVYLSGWVSDTFVYCVETAKYMAIVAIRCEQETVLIVVKNVFYVFFIFL